MLIKSLRMKNFRQFSGETYVEFSIDPEKNVTVILGNNTFGKTTLLQAFNWCFYNKVLFDENPDDLLNYEVASKMYNGESEEVVVEIKLIHNDTEYTITRSQKNTKTSGKFAKKDNVKVVALIKDDKGKTVPKTFESEDEVKKIINTILPEDLSKYFFFDTERVNSISTKKDVGDAVKSLLGLSSLSNLISHIGMKSQKTSVLGILYTGFDLNGNKQADATLDTIHKLQSERDNCKAIIDNCNEEINYFETRKEQLNDLIKANEDVSNLQKRKMKLEKDFEDEEKHLEKSIKWYKADFNNGNLRFFMSSLLKRAELFLKEVKLDDKGIKGLTRPTLLEILKRGKCICGCELNEGEDAYNHILDEMKYVPPEHIGNTVKNYISAIHSYSTDAESFSSKLTDSYADILRTRTKMLAINSEIEEISEAIQGKEDVSAYEVELKKVKNTIKEKSASRDSAIRREGEIIKDIEGKQKLYDSLISKSAKNVETMRYIKYAEDILEWATDTYKEKEQYVLESLQDRVNDIFERMYHGTRKVVITKNFNVELLTTVADTQIKTGKSEGLDRVKNFAFIGGLVALAKEKIISKAGENEFDLASEPYPLVMDAPFSNADEEHTSNISKVLPEVAEQVIMFVMKKDFNIAEPVMRDRIGKQFELVKFSETRTELR